jgi:hypothetical protein
MSGNDEQHFVTHSDEDLARLLEAQLSSLRIPNVGQPLGQKPESDKNLDDIFGALRESSPAPLDSPRPPDPIEILSSGHFFEVTASTQTDYGEISVDEPENTLPITHVVDSVVDETPILLKVVSDDFGTEIGVDTAIAETATAVPVPSMFVEADYIAAVLDASEPELAPDGENTLDVVHVSVVEETILPSAVTHAPVPVPTDPVTTQSVAPDRVAPVAPATLSQHANPLLTFEPRPTFDELVFGASSDD